MAAETQPINLTDTVVRSTGQVSSELDGEAMLMSIETGKYYHMNEVATRLWQLIEKPQKVSALIDQLLSEFEIDRPTCESQVQSFLTSLTESHLIDRIPLSAQ
jgi:hypothetical protein